MRPRALLMRLAVGHFAQSLHRNSITIASLVVALAMVVGISTMIFSFRTTVEEWLNRSIQSDLVIAPAANLLVGNREFIRPEVERIVTALPHVKVDSFRELRVLVRGQWVKLATVRLGVTRDIERLTFTQGDPDAAFDAAMHHDAILVSEPFRRRFHLGLGDSLTLDTPVRARTPSASPASISTTPRRAASCWSTGPSSRNTGTTDRSTASGSTSTRIGR